MSSSTDKLARELYNAISKSEERKPSPYDTEAEVTRVDDFVWVKIPGGIDETPVRKTINAKPGDNVQVRVADGRAWVVGNSTNPPTDDTTAIRAKEVAEKARTEAESAGYNAQLAQQLAESNAIYMVNAVVEINSDISDLQNQIDGNITTWFYDYEPTVSNAPASTWTTVEEKNNHLGDLFYNTSTGYAYRWMSDGASTPTFSWAKITDTDVTLALATAQNAQDTADHKRRVFITQPVVPYDIGDLWCEGSTGDILTCVTAKSEVQSFSASDWSKLNKYTDDARADEAYSLANTAKISADGKNKIYRQATQPSDGTYVAGDVWFDTSHTNKIYRYSGSAWVAVTLGDDALASLSANKLTAGTIDASVITVSNLDAGNITTGNLAADCMKVNSIDAINDNTGTVKIKASKVQIDGAAIFTAISDKVDNAIDGAVDDIDVGGKNLLRGTETLTITTSDYNWAHGQFYKSNNGGTLENVTLPSTPIPSVTKGLKATITTANTLIGFAQGSVPIRKQELTQSVWVKGTSGDVVMLQPIYATASGTEESGNKSFTIADSDWHKYTFTKTPNYDHLSGISAGYVYIKSNTVGREIYICADKLEYGNKATDWSPAPEDVNDAIDNIEVGSRNYLKTNYPIGRTDTRLGVTSTITGPSSFTISGTCTSDGWAFNASNVFGNIYLEAGTYIVSITPQTSDIQYRIGLNTGTSSSEWKFGGFYPKIITITAAGNYDFVPVVIKDKTYSSSVEYKVKFEKGNKATDWTPAPEDVDSAINDVAAVANAAAPQSSAVGRSQRIYYRKTSSGAPSALTTWLTTSGTGYGNWSLKIPQMTNGTTKYPYLYTAVQTQTVSQMSGTACSCSTVLLDDTTTVIDGGTIITGTVAANRIDATSGTFSEANIPNLSADKIKANVISAVNSGTGKISADKIQVSDISIGSLAGTVGGRNYAVTNIDAIPIGSVSTRTGVTATLLGPSHFRLNGTSTKADWFFPAGKLFGGIMLEVGTYKVWCTSGNVRIRIGSGDSSTYVAGTPACTKSSPYTLTVSTKQVYWFTPYCDASVAYSNQDVKLMVEMSDRPTDWSPAPEDAHTDNTNMLLDWDAASVNKIEAASTRYWSGVQTYFTNTFITLSDPPERGIHSGIRVVLTAAQTAAVQMAYAFYGADTVANGAIPMSNGNSYTMSCWARCTSGSGRVRLAYRDNGTVKLGPVVTLTSAWTRVMLPFVITNVDYGRVYFYANWAANATGTVEMCGFKCVSNIDATAYITNIDNNGIRIHPTSTINNSVVINASGMEVFKGGTEPANSVAFYGDSARVGKESARHINVSANNLAVVDSSGSATFSVSPSTRVIDEAGYIKDLGWINANNATRTLIVSSRITTLKVTVGTSIYQDPTELTEYDVPLPAGKTVAGITITCAIPAQGLYQLTFKNTNTSKRYIWYDENYSYTADNILVNSSNLNPLFGFYNESEGSGYGDRYEILNIIADSGVIVNARAIKFGQVCSIEIHTRNTATVGGQGQIFRGSIYNPNFLPFTQAPLIGYWGDRPLIGYIGGEENVASSDYQGLIYVRNASSSSISANAATASNPFILRGTYVAIR